MKFHFFQRLRSPARMLRVGDTTVDAPAPRAPNQQWLDFGVLSLVATSTTGIFPWREKIAAAYVRKWERYGKPTYD